MEARPMSRTPSKNPMLFKAPDAYMRLIRRFPLRPILEQSDYDPATAVREKIAIRADTFIFSHIC